MAAEYELTLNDYLQILRRRAFHLAGAFALFVSITVVVAVAIPPVYQSTGTILIESQQIPTDLIQATVTTFADERIEVIRQRVMTRENLIRIIEKYHLFKDDRRKLSPSEYIDEMRENIAIDLINANMKPGQWGKATIAFKVSFNYREADIAHKVANEIVTLFLDENVKSRTERASETTEFLAQEADRLKAEIEKIENQVAAYKQEHANALPEHLEMRMKLMQQTESDLNELERDYKDTQERLRYMDIELASAKAGFGSRQNSGATMPAPASELESLQAELAKLSATYKDTHPDIKALKRKIEALEKSQATKPADIPDKPQPVATTASDLIVAKVQVQIDAANARLLSIDQQRKNLRARLSQLQNEIMRSPQVEHGLSTLLRDYETAKKKYEEVSSKRGNARIAENLEQENKAERFSLLEPPLLPEKPIKPDRKKIIVMGVFISLGVALGLVMLMETINQRVRGADALTALIGKRPLVIVPYITIQSELSRKKYLNIYIAVGLLLLGLIVVVAVHFIWMPLDILMYKIMTRLS